MILRLEMLISIFDCSDLHIWLLTQISHMNKTWGVVPLVGGLINHVMVQRIAEDTRWNTRWCHMGEVMELRIFCRKLEKYINSYSSLLQNTHILVK